ncbi:MAG: hypothetical protein HKN13_01275, partial [Rhodothermales bacterium]|nr:hypothetical protein [Rhodothermales bacterium]
LEVLDNDFDDQPLEITSLSTAGILGTATISSDGLAIDYEPPIAFVGRDRFEYTVRDTDGLPEVALVTVDVIAKPADLVVSNVTVPPDVFSGEPLSFEFTVTNAGTGATRAPYWEDRVTLSSSTSLSDRVADTILRNPTFLDAGESYTVIETIKVPDGLEGPHFLIVQTDFRDYQEEPDNGNNLAASLSPIQVNLTPPPDLQVTALSVPSTAFSGSEIDVLYTVTNEGIGATEASAWRDVILGIDAEENVTTLATLSRQGALASGESYDRTANVSLPNAISGEYIVRVLTDPTVEINLRTGERDRGSVFENLLEENNSRNDSLDVTLSPPPDLVPVAVSVPQTALSGQPISVSWTVENQGAGAPFETSWSDRLYLSTDQALDTESDFLLGSTRLNTPPDAGSSYNGSANPVIRNGLSGSFFVLVVGDANREVFEHTFEDNNIVASSEAVEITVPPTPDLIVSTVTAPADASAGERIFVSWTVTNAGDVPVGGRWVDRVYLSSDPTFSRSTSAEIGARGCNPCSYAAGEEYSTGLQVALAVDLDDGPSFLHVVTDADDGVYEHLTESNNAGTSAEMTLLAYPPVDLVVEGLALSADSVDSGAPLTVNWTVRNTGTGETLSSSWVDRVHLSSDDQLDSSDRLLATVRRSEVLAAAAGYDRSATIATPDNLGGTFFLIVQADAQSQVSEENDDNNASVAAEVVIEEVAPPDLRPTAFLAPSQAVAGQPITVSWTVLNQGDGATVDPHWFEGIYLSDISSLTSSARRIGTFERVGGLASDSTYTDSTEVTIPAFASGSQFLLFETDSGSNVFEGPRETNNMLARPLSIVLNEPSDLIVSSVTSPPVAEPGREVTIEYTVKNEGTFPAVGLVMDAAYVSADAVWDLDDPAVAIIPQQLELAPGASQKRSMTVDVGRTLQEAAGRIADDLPGVLPGDYQILVRTDVRNAIRETEDGNNVSAASTTTSVAIDELRLDEAATFDLAAGQSQYFALMVGAGQDFRFSLTSNDAAAANDIYIAFERVPGPEDFDFGTPAPNESNQVLYVPSTEAGTFYVR